MGSKLKFVRGVIAAVMGAGLATQTVHAGGPVAIPNGSFENPDASPVPVYHALPIAYQSDWVHAPQPGDWPYPNDTFAWDNTAGVFNNDSFAATPNFVAGVSGAQGGFFFNSFHNQISQELATNWNLGSVYHISLAAQGGGQGMPVGTQLKVWVYYVDSGNKIPVKEYLISNTFDNQSAGPITALVNYGFDTDAIGAAAAGKAIGIAITSTASSYSGNDFGYWDIDNVQIAELPEPASLGVIGIGALALLSRRRRRD